MNNDCMKEIKAYYSKKKSAKRTHLRGMDEFLNLKDDDKVEDEEGAGRVRDEAATREGEEGEAREAKVTRQGAEAKAAEQGTEAQGE